MNDHDHLPAVTRVEDSPARARAHNYTLADLKSIAKDVVDSRLFPGIGTVQQAFTLMLLCEAENIHPMQAMQRFNIIQGRPAMKADAMLAEFQARGGRVKWLAMTDTECEAIFSHPSFAPEGVPSSFTMADAKRAELLKNPTWQKYPKNMLRARVISNGVRIVMPGIVAGIYTPEEVSDFDDRPRAIQAALAPPEPPVDPPGTKPKGKDTRPYHELAFDGVEATNATFRDEHPGTADVVNSYQLDRHLVRVALEAGVMDATLIPDQRKAKALDLARALSVLYGTPEGRPWIRREMADYLARKLAEARAKAVMEEQGDGDAFEGLVEVEGGELVPAVPAAEVLEPDAGERG